MCSRAPRLAAIGWPAVTRADDARRGPTLAVPSRDAAALLARQLEDDIVKSCRNDNLRASIHFHRSEADIDRFAAALAAHRERFGFRS